jgi:hypothetical protein
MQGALGVALLAASALGAGGHQRRGRGRQHAHLPGPAGRRGDAVAGQRDEHGGARAGVGERLLGVPKAPGGGRGLRGGDGRSQHCGRGLRHVAGFAGGRQRLRAPRAVAHPRGDGAVCAAVAPRAVATTARPDGAAAGPGHAPGHGGLSVPRGGVRRILRRGHRHHDARRARPPRPPRHPPHEQPQEPRRRRHQRRQHGAVDRRRARPLARRRGDGPLRGARRPPRGRRGAQGGPPAWCAPW